MTLPSQQPLHEVRSTPGREPIAQAIHRPWIMLLALLPLIILDQLGLYLRAGSAQENLAKEHLRLALLFFDVPPRFALFAGGIIIVLVLFIWHLFKNDSWRIRPIALPWIPIEGALWSIPMLVIAPLFTATALAAPSIKAELAALPMIDRLLVSLSAGLYEELIFRMVGIALLHAIFVDLLRLRHVTGTVLAIAFTSIAFCWYHDPIASPAMGIFALLAGIELGVIFVCRGFAVAVWAHVLYDVVITTTL